MGTRDQAGAVGLAGMTTRAIQYTRVSKDDQATSGLGLEAQAEACRACAARSGLAVEGRYADEGLGGKLGLEDRPGLMAAIDALGAGDVLLVAKLDRLSRGDVVAAALIERMVQRAGARIVSAAGEGTENDDPSSVLMRRMVAAFAAYEVMLISIRTKAAQRARGERAGGIPFGWACAVGLDRLMPVPEQLETLAEARAMRAAGRSYRAIAGHLNATGRAAAQGGEWTPASVRSVIMTADRSDGVVKG